LSERTFSLGSAEGWIGSVSPLQLLAMPAKTAEAKQPKGKEATSAKGAEAKQQKGTQKGKAAGKKGGAKAAAKKGSGKSSSGKGGQDWYNAQNPVSAPPPGLGAPYWYQPMGPVGYAPPPSQWVGTPMPTYQWAIPTPLGRVPMDPWSQKGQGKGWQIEKGKAEKATWTFCQGEFWYASTNEAFDKMISTTGIDCSKGKHRGCVRCHKSREDAEATAKKFAIGRVHKIDMVAMEDYYSGPKGKGGTIWTYGPTMFDVSDLPPEDQNFVRPQFIESFEVGAGTTLSPPAQILNPECVDDPK